MAEVVHSIFEVSIPIISFGHSPPISPSPALPSHLCRPCPHCNSVFDLPPRLLSALLLGVVNEIHRRGVIPTSAATNTNQNPSYNRPSIQHMAVGYKLIFFFRLEKKNLI
jgi:hypothetical protein